ncbi:aldehyde dehydrogenase family protein [Amycolatopsis suaedae]|uniref:Aldehyde dehydrogenase family protein n=1 Tax=Amycolatopsis suaedae TaxID=2510978 RepID=A0A4Q7IZQ5_9PSEU|nr:aldehyde dehydrogenase family protein [Amycolatopsis suaedae]RZQ59752.1 aldehyde dehydrogenase family protein [Amycolatopsis suaedae]
MTSVVTWADVYGRGCDLTPDAFVPQAQPEGPAALEAVQSALSAHRVWREMPLAQRATRVLAAVDALERHRSLLAVLLEAETGTPRHVAVAEVDRCLAGVRRFLADVGPRLRGRDPLPGPVGNIASWNYPAGLLTEAMLVQALAGNAVITTTDSRGPCFLTTAVALAVRAGLPVTLVGAGALPMAGAVTWLDGRHGAGEAMLRAMTLEAAAARAAGIPDPR